MMSRSHVEYLRKTMVGRRVELENMPNDPDPIPRGTRGTVTYVDDGGTLSVDWDNGRKLGLLPGTDRWRTFDEGEEIDR